MSITTEILRIKGGKNAIKTLASKKNINIPSTTLIDAYASVLGQNWPDVTIGISYDGSKIRGNTKKINQIIKNGNFTDSSNWNEANSAATYNNNECVISPNALFGQIYQTQSGKFIQGHKYFCSLYAKYISGNVSIRLQVSNNINLLSTQLTPNYTKYETITTASVDSNQAIVLFNTTTTNSFAIKNIMIVDLTKIYGAGNEPTTIQELEEDYPQLNYFIPYTEGSLIYSYYKGIKLGLYDYIDLSTNKLHIGGGEYTFKGNESWNVSSVTGTDMAYSDELLSKVQGPSNNSQQADCIVDKYPTVSRNSMTVGGSGFQSSQYPVFFVFVPVGEYTSQSWKTYLQSNNITVYYKLANPIEIQLP